MNTHWGKYSGPLAALTERWILEGDFGETDWSNSDIGEGIVLWRAPFSLTYDESKFLRTEFGCTTEELDQLDAEMSGAQGIVHEWNSQGFLFGSALATMSEVKATLERLIGLQQEEALDG